MAVVKQHWTTRAGQATGHPAAFGLVIVYGLLWFYFSKATFEWNAAATLAVWVMTLFIQRSNCRPRRCMPNWTNCCESIAAQGQNLRGRRAGTRGYSEAPR